MDICALRSAQPKSAAQFRPATSVEYEQNLEDNLQDLLDRVQSGSIGASHVRRVHIPKGGSSTQTCSIGIPTLENKVLQWAVVMLLEPIYEQDFLACSYAFRPGRSAHQALAAFRGQLTNCRGGHVIEVDVRKFFDNLVHGHVRVFLRLRVRGRPGASRSGVLKLAQELLLGNLLHFCGLNRTLATGQVRVHGGTRRPIRSRILTGASASAWRVAAGCAPGLPSSVGAAEVNIARPRTTTVVQGAPGRGRRWHPAGHTPCGISLVSSWNRNRQIYLRYPAPSSPQDGIISASMNELTQVLERIRKGEPSAAEALLPLVYEELRKLAAQKMAQEKSGQTLQPTALVHEAYLRLMDVEQRQRWDGRGHFFAAAAEAMRRILVESARRKGRRKRGGSRQRVDLADSPAPAADDRLLALDEALTRLAAEDPAAARVVELRHFAGLGHEQVAATLGITVYQARQKWTYARAWLRDALDG
jgi:RNA polymerase sigma factor (TIGR02999 family)